MNEEYTIQETRDAILKFLQSQDENNVTHTPSEILQKTLFPIPENKLYRELRYLKEQGFITAKGTLTDPFCFTTITAKGRDSIENIQITPNTQTIVNNFNDIKGSPISINSQEVRQNIQYNDSNILTKIWNLIKGIFGI